MKTSELIGPALNWAVCWAVHGVAPVKSTYPGLYGWRDSNMGYLVKPYSTSWKHGGPIIERERIDICHHHVSRYVSALIWFPTKHVFTDTNILVAAMRCYVASKLGDEVEIPEELT